MTNRNGTFEYSGSYYEEIGDFLEGNYLQYGFTKGTVQEVDFLMELMDLKAGSRLLDIGCGPGRHSLELARRGVHPLGVDISSGFIKHARQAALDESLNAEFVTADARELKFEDEFDGAICLCEGAFGLAGHLDNHRKVLQGTYRALKSGTYFVLTAINALSAARNVTEAGSFDPYSSTTTEEISLVILKGKQDR